MPLSPIREITTLELRPLGSRRIAPTIRTSELDASLDLNFPGCETQYSTHGLHPYVAAINPPLASHLIKHYVPEGETVFDPFCGGGGVLVEALLNGRNGIGYDVNPLAVVVSKAKTTYIPITEASAELRRIVEQAHQESPEITDVPEVIKFWYLPESLPPLRALQMAVLQTEKIAVKNLFRAVLSATARDVMLTYRGEIRLRKLQGKDLSNFHPDVWYSFQKERKLPLLRSLPCRADKHPTFFWRILGKFLHHQRTRLLARRRMLMIRMALATSNSVAT